MKAYKIETKLEEEGELRLSKLPFRAGDEVEVIVRLREPAASTARRYPLRGLPIRYDDPTGPVAVNDWEALRSTS
jgi:hypothetical protein